MGCQTLRAENFPHTATVSSASWLGAPFQGKGLGTTMRASVLHFAFSQLNAQYATTTYVEGNNPSRRVSEKMGYEQNGYSVNSYTLPAGEVEVAKVNSMILTKERWESFRPSFCEEITFEGVEECLPFLL